MEVLGIVLLLVVFVALVAWRVDRRGGRRRTARRLYASGGGEGIVDASDGCDSSSSDVGGSDGGGCGGE